MRLRPALMALGVALIAPLSRAYAAEPVALTWDAPASCPSRESVLTDVRRILGETTEHDAVARAHVTEDGPHHWSLQLATEVDGASGERSMEADSCQASPRRLR